MKTTRILILLKMIISLLLFRMSMIRLIHSSLRKFPRKIEGNICKIKIAKAINMVDPWIP